MKPEDIDSALARIPAGSTLTESAPKAQPVELVRYQPRNRVIVNGAWELAPNVAPNTDELADRRARHEALEFRSRLSGVPDWKWARVGAQELAERVSPTLLAAAATWSPERSPRLVLAGKAGAGKTAAAVACCWRLGLQTKWTSARELATARREHPLGEGEPPAITRAAEAALLVLDDLGTEQVSSETTDILHGVLDRRYLRDLPTITTTPMSVAQLEARYGAGVTRRLVDRAKLVTV